MPKNAGDITTIAPTAGTGTARRRGKKRGAKSIRSTAKLQPRAAARKSPAGKSGTASKKQARNTNPVSYPNIDKSAFRRGEYVGYANGNWIIRSTGNGWRAIHRDNRAAPFITGETLGEISQQLEAYALSAAKLERRSNPVENELRFIVVIRGFDNHIFYWTGDKFTVDRKFAGLFSEKAATVLANTAAAKNRTRPVAVVREDQTQKEIGKFVTARLRK